MIHIYTTSMRRLLGPLLIFAIIGCAQTVSKTLPPDRTNECLKNHMALDIGSGSSKVLFALVDTCLQKIVNVHWQESFPLKIKESLKDNQNKIPIGLSSSLVTKIRDWQERAGQRPIHKYKAVATEAFRQSHNGTQFIQKVSIQTNIPIRIINQEEEGLFGFWSALAKSQRKAKEIVVWDIGGGSMQITSLSDISSLKSHLNSLGAVNFKDRVLKMKKDHQPLTSNRPSSSPNPLGKHFAHKAVQMAQTYASKMIPQEMKREILKKPVLGIGGVHSKSILPKVKLEEKQDFYTDTQLKNLLEKYQRLNDTEVGGTFPETDVTNIALVLGFMKALKIKRVQVVPVDLTYGLLIAPSK